MNDNQHTVRLVTSQGGQGVGGWSEGTGAGGLELGGRQGQEGPIRKPGLSSAAIPKADS